MKELKEQLDKVVDKILAYKYEKKKENRHTRQKESTNIPMASKQKTGNKG